MSNPKPKRNDEFNNSSTKKKCFICHSVKNIKQLKSFYMGITSGVKSSFVMVCKTCQVNRPNLKQEIQRYFEGKHPLSIEDKITMVNLSGYNFRN